MVRAGREGRSVRERATPQRRRIVHERAVRQKRPVRERALLQKRRFPLRAALLALAALVLAAVALFDAFVFPLHYLLRPLPALAARGEGELCVHFIDVGQGDATLLCLPDGKFMLIDGGDGSAEASGALVSALRAAGVKRLDYVLLTHADADHSGGLREAVRLFGADTVFMPPAERAAAGTPFGDFYEAAVQAGAEVCLSQMYEAVYPADAGEDFYYLLFLAPLPPSSENSAYRGEDDNESSAVVWLEYAGRSLLFTGDAGEETEAALADLFSVLGPEALAYPAETSGGTVWLAPDLASLDFLKAGHHGSAGSTGEALLAAARPEAVFFSAGAGNAYRHPAHSVAARIREHGSAAMYRTDELGTVTLTVRRGGGYEVTWTGK